MDAKGSLLQVRLYVNDHPAELEAGVAEIFPELAARSVQFRWTAPLAANRFKEPRDEAFLRAIERPDLAPALDAFWPARGPVWDALAVLDLDGAHGALLVEGKSYPAELYGGGSKAKDPKSVAKIREALARTQAWLGLRANPDLWLGPLYQTANRYAYLYWLREVAGVEAWLAHTLFVNDTTHVAASRVEWATAVGIVESELGLTGAHVPYAGHVFLPALSRPA